MRCKNCGWPNKPNVTNCVKCGTPLTFDDDSDMSVNNTSNAGTGEGLKETVRENEVFVGNEEINKPCPKCGYPLRPDTEKCPNCKFQISGPSQSAYSPDAEPMKNHVGRKPTRVDFGSGIHGGTVNPYMMNMDLEPSFILKPIKRVNERHELEDLEFEGKSVSLNRDNTEANNPSITSKEQAVITNEDGRWYIEDKSEQKTPLSRLLIE